ncbi:hypothetical protein EDB19DRAFT_1902255 [Suillus lakei]|nr:hypothetical protein EDB19DRAFT_1902255 [Suillus lakei]
MSRPPSTSTSNSHSASAFYQPPSALSQPHRALHLPPIAESPLAQFSCPAPLLTTCMPATLSFSQPALSSLSPPASSWPSLPHYTPIATPYSCNPRFSATQVSPSFGVPHASIPISTTAGCSRVHSNRKTIMPYSVSKPAKQVSEKQVNIVIFPNDIHAGPAAPDSVDDIFEDTYLYFGLVHHITLIASMHNEIIMNQVYNSVLAISTSHIIQFPPEPECSFDLDASAPDRKFRIQFQHLPSHLLKVGYQMPKGHYLSFDTTETWQDYSFHALSKCVNQIQHPTDFNVGLLIICPNPIDSDDDLYAPPTIPSTPDNQPHVLPSISSPSTSLSSISSPSLNSLPALTDPQTSFPTVIDLTLPSPNHSSHLLHSPPHSPIVCHHSVYASPTLPSYETLLEVDDAIMRAFGSEVEHSMVHIHGPTVKAFAEGLIDFLCQQQRNSNTPYEQFSIWSHNQKLSDIGCDGAHDASNKGVMRQVLTEALAMCLSESSGITQTLNKDGFHVLCIHVIFHAQISTSLNPNPILSIQFLSNLPLFQFLEPPDHPEDWYCFHWNQWTLYHSPLPLNTSVLRLTYLQLFIHIDHLISVHSGSI